MNVLNGPYIGFLISFVWYIHYLLVRYASISCSLPSPGIRVRRSEFLETKLPKLLHGRVNFYGNDKKVVRLENEWSAIYSW